MSAARLYYDGPPFCKRKKGLAHTECVPPRCLHRRPLGLGSRSRREEFELLLAVPGLFFGEQFHGVVAGGVVAPFVVHGLVIPFIVVIAGGAMGVKVVGVQGGSIE